MELNRSDDPPEYSEHIELSYISRGAREPTNPRVLSTIPESSEGSTYRSSNIERPSENDSGPSQYSYLFRPLTSSELKLQIANVALHITNVYSAVALCVVFVVVTINSVEYYQINDSTFVPFFEALRTPSIRFRNSAINSVLYAMGLIFITAILSNLYVNKHYKIIRAYLIIISLVLLFPLSYIYFHELCRTYSIVLDYPTSLLIMWNFGVIGLMAIHWRAPIRLQQAYLIFDAGLMALIILKYVPNFTTWGVMVIASGWDLYAVLFRAGPVRVIFEVGRERNEQIFHGMVYSSVIHEERTTPQPAQVATLSRSTTTRSRRSRGQQEEEEGGFEEIQLETFNQNIYETADGVMMVQSAGPSSAADQQVPVIPVVPVVPLVPEIPVVPVTPVIPVVPVEVTPAEVAAAEVAAAEVAPAEEVISNENPTSSAGSPRTELSDEETKFEYHMGLGDFVFFAVLVGKVSTYGDWAVTLACFIAILGGMCFTLRLMYKFDLTFPALPISILFGFIYGFLGSVTIKPFMEKLAAEQAFI